jgi:ribosomal protein L12E/L44/L45/RPP1/RPP2
MSKVSSAEPFERFAALFDRAKVAVPVDPNAVAALNEDAINAEVERRQRLLAAAAAAKEARDKRRAAAAAAASNDDDETVSEDDDSGGGSRMDAAEARRKYLCRTQRRC